MHLPDHIRRFGPASLFATEAFESFNAIIRAKSVHSNRHAPSRDIAFAFAQGNRVRHLLSGGLFPDVSLVPPESSCQSLTSSSPTHLSIFPHSAQDWHSIGSGPKNLVASTSTVTTYLGLSSKTTDNLVGTCVSDKQPPRPYSSTLSGKKCPTAALQVNVKTYNRVVLVNGDACTLGAYVIAHDEASIGSTYVGVVREIVRHRNDVSPPALLL